MGSLVSAIGIRRPERQPEKRPENIRVGVVIDPLVGLLTGSLLGVQGGLDLSPGHQVLVQRAF